MWHHTSSAWMLVTGDGLNDLSFSVAAGSQGKGSWKSGGDRSAYEGKRDRDGDIPEWDGERVDRRTYYRKIEVWEATTGLEPWKRAVRLLGRLSGKAFDKLSNIERKSLLVDDGVTRFKNFIEDAYEPVEDYRVGKVMDHFLDDFSRKSGQDIVDYNLSWENELRKAERCAGELTSTWKAHLYLSLIHI